MHKVSLTAQALAVLKTYAMRPLMWVACLIVGFGCLVLLTDSRLVQLRDAFPSPFDRSGADVLRDGETFLQWASDGTIHPEITAIDLNSMGSAISIKNLDPVTRRAELRMFDELQQVLLQFPNVETLQFDMQQLPFVQPETLAGLTKLRSVRVRDLPITDRHLNLLAQVESLEYLELQTIDLPASLTPLEALPKLTTVVISSGYYNMTDAPAASPYRRQVLGELRDLPALRRLVLKPFYLPGIGSFAGSPEPDPSCEPILKQNVAEVFRGHPRLTHLWVGANQRQEERAQLRVIAEGLPHTAVNAATYDSSKFMKVGGGAIALGMAMGLVVLQLVSQFSSPASQLLPGFAGRHLAVAGCLMLSALLAMVVSVSRQEVSILSALSVFAMAPGIVLGFNAWWDRMMTSPRGWKDCIPAASATLIFLAILWSSHFPPQLAQRIDQFLIGAYPLVASVMLLGALAGIIAGLSTFVGLHRAWAELSLVPAMTLQELGENRNSLALRRLGDDYLAGSIAGWRHALQVASERLQQRSWLALCRMWYLGQTPMKLVRGILIVALISFASVYFASVRSAPSAHFVVHYAVFMVMYVALVLVAIVCLSRRSTLSLDLLYPVSRRDWISSTFATVFMQVAAATSVALLVAWIQRALLLDVPEVISLLRGVAATGALTVLMTGTILWVMLSHRIVSAVPAVLLSMFAIGVASMVVVDTGVGPSPMAAAAVLQWLQHAAVLPGLWLLAITTLALTFRSWTRAEFAAES